MCDDGVRGIAQCLSGGDWGECVCNPSSLELEPDASSVEETVRHAGRGSARPVTEDPALRDCESTFDFRAHAVGNFSAPYRVPARGLLPGSERQRVCFYFRVPYVVDSVALSFLGLLYETPGLRSWTLYGLDSSLHADGEVSPCNGAEPGAYVLAGFAPGVADLVLPDDVGLALPHGTRAGMVLEVQYENDSPEELLDRTGVRVCAARMNSREHTAAVHFTGTQGICIPPAAHDFAVHGSCTPRDDLGSIHVLDVWPSMHQRGRRMHIDHRARRRPQGSAARRTVHVRRPATFRRARRGAGAGRQPRHALLLRQRRTAAGALRRERQRGDLLRLHHGVACGRAVGQPAGRAGWRAGHRARPQLPRYRRHPPELQRRRRRW